MISDIDFGNGKIVYNDFNIKKDIPLEEQIWELKEDLLQVKYSFRNKDVYLIDVGWYPEFNVNGEFRLCLVKNYNWDIPIRKVCCKFDDLKESIFYLVKFTDMS